MHSLRWFVLRAGLEILGVFHCAFYEFAEFVDTSQTVGRSNDRLCEANSLRPRSYIDYNSDEKRVLVVVFNWTKSEIPKYSSR